LLLIRGIAFFEFHLGKQSKQPAEKGCDAGDNRHDSRNELNHALAAGSSD
jgi:hypothetical protein